MASSCAWHQPICSAVAYAVLASTIAVPTRSGWVTAHSSARMPPIEPPRTVCQRSTPRASASRASVCTWSRTVMNGKRLPHGLPSGAGLEGPVLPWQPPSTLAATTK